MLWGKGGRPGIFDLVVLKTINRIIDHVYFAIEVTRWLQSGSCELLEGSWACDRKGVLSLE
jgi:hypothetical protein